eukprot:Gb_25691 [translate_table: standard]
MHGNWQTYGRRATMQIDGVTLHFNRLVVCLGALMNLHHWHSWHSLHPLSFLHSYNHPSTGESEHPHLRSEHINFFAQSEILRCKDGCNYGGMINEGENAKQCSKDEEPKLVFKCTMEKSSLQGKALWLLEGSKQSGEQTINLLGNPISIMQPKGHIFKDMSIDTGGKYRRCLEKHMLSRSTKLLAKETAFLPMEHREKRRCNSEHGVGSNPSTDLTMVSSKDQFVALVFNCMSLGSVLYPEVVPVLLCGSHISVHYAEMNALLHWGNQPVQSATKPIDLVPVELQQPYRSEKERESGSLVGLTTFTAI